MAQRDDTLIPTSFLGLDIPTQRWYALSFGALLQAFKVADFVAPAITSILSSPATSSASNVYYLWKWLVLDALYISGLPRLRLPKLKFAWQASLLQFVVFAFINYALFGAWNIEILRPLLLIDLVPPLHYKLPFVGRSDGSSHLQGQHAIYFAPLDTVQLNPYGDTFCLSSSNSPVYIPVLFNNTVPSSIRVQTTALSGVPLSNEVQHTRDMAVQRPSLVGKDEDEDEDEDASSGDTSSSRTLERSQSIRTLKIIRQGKITITDAEKAHVRLGEVTVVECPSASFPAHQPTPPVRCLGEEEKLEIRLKGVPPLSLSYSRLTDSRRERFFVDSIVGSPTVKSLAISITNVLMLVCQDLVNPSYEDVVSLPIKLTSSGTHIFSLESVTDALGNTVSLQSSVTLEVARRASFGFSQCSHGRSIPLLVTGSRSAELRLSSRDMDPRDAPYSVRVMRAEDGETQQVTASSSHETTAFQAKRPGTYEIVSVSGKHCRGIVMSPASCKVVEQPLPRVNVTWSRIHECSGDTGVTASLVLQGKPPFDVFYTTKRDAGQARVVKETFTGSRGEIVLQPEESGRYQYQFTKMTDAYYRDVPISYAETMEQTVRPLAFAQFRRAGGSGGRMNVNSCSGSFVEVEVEFKGTPPWSIELQVVGPQGLEPFSKKDIKKPVDKLRIPIPAEIDRDGGNFQVDIVNVADVQGCKRALTVPGIQVDVRRIKPTAKFYSDDETASVSILQGETASLPLRLTGDGPWTVNYSRLESDKQETHIAKVTNANDAIRVHSPGLYTIQEVHDKYCAGEVQTPSRYNVEWLAKPSVEIQTTDGLRYLQHSAVYLKEPVCQGAKDTLTLTLNGTPPFQISYSMQLRPVEGVEESRRTSFSSIQRTTSFDLETSNPGFAEYIIEQLGDALYPADRVHRDGLRIRQEIMERPRANFIDPQPLTFCLYDTFVPRSTPGNTGIIALSGKPPFYLELSIQSLATGEIHKERVQTNDRRWTVAVKNYKFRTVGAYTVTIDSVLDSSRCSEDVSPHGSRVIVVNVAETAAIVPFDRRTDYCVGDKMRFQLEGIPPWHVSYKINDRSHRTKVHDPHWDRVADVAGTFSITGLSHQTAMCQTPIDDLNYKIYEIPTAKVGHGKQISKLINEGEQAEIKFDLLGVPPFTFTYQRSELPSSRRGHTPAVLETHTVTGVTTHEYSILSSQEGVWTVTFIADKYCKFPQNVESK